MSRAIRGLYRRYATSGEYTWYIDKCIKRVGRLCESTATADRDEAERYLLHRIRELRDIAIYGVRPRISRRFRRQEHHPPGRRGASTASSATLWRVAAALPARAGRSRLSLHERTRGGGTTACSGSLPQNFLANFDPPLSSRQLSQCIGASASVECSTSTTAQLPERLRSSFWTVRDRALLQACGREARDPWRVSSSP